MRLFWFALVILLIFTTSSVFCKLIKNYRSNDIKIKGFKSDVNKSVRNKLKSRIYNGDTVTNIKDFHYQAGLLLKYQIDNEWRESWCGGSLIDKNYILTASHCLIDVDKVTIYLGTIDRKSPERSKFSKMIEATKKDFIIHENYTLSKYNNDIALIKLKKSVEISDAIKPIQLIQTKDKAMIDKKLAIISGWGRTADDDWEAYEELQYAKIKVLSSNECEKTIKSLPLKSSINTSDLICADTREDRGVCKGDSGGPVVEMVKRQPIQIGINAFVISGDSTCEDVAARMFTRITEHREWICKHSGICENST